VVHPLLDLPPLTAERFAEIERGVAALLRTGNDVVITQGEALLPLEGTIRGGARPGSSALNVVTGPYGQTFGGWLRDAGARVVDLEVPFHTAATAEEIGRALAEHPEIDFVSLVHAEAATGNTNPVAEIGEVVRAHGALLMVDAVASVAAEPLLTDAWGVDLCVIGAQKAMGGPAGVSAVAVSERAWERIADNPAAPRRSYLSLLDWKERWIDGGRRVLPHAPAQLEMLALEACVARIEAVGLDAVIARHRTAAAAARAGVGRRSGAIRVRGRRGRPGGHDAAHARRRRGGRSGPVRAGGGRVAAAERRRRGAHQGDDPREPLRARRDSRHRAGVSDRPGVGAARGGRRRGRGGGRRGVGPGGVGLIAGQVIRRPESSGVLGSQG
jgi:hypothetical protein